jgi:hypothetical protein
MYFVIICTYPTESIPDYLESYRSKPLTPKNFKFEPANDSSNTASCQASIIVDSSTVELLKTRLGEFEKRLKASETHLTSKSEEVAKLKASM